MITAKLAALSVERSKAGVRLGVRTIPTALVAALVSIVLGAATIFTVGFLHSDLLHAAAHDVRHAAGFPCH